MNPFDSTTTMIFVLAIAMTYGMRRHRSATLVIQKYSIAVEPEPTSTPIVEIVGRTQGIVAFVLTLLGFSPIVRFTIVGAEIRYLSTSLFGQRSQFIPLRCVSTMAAGIHKPISALIWAAFSLIAGTSMSLTLRWWTTFWWVPFVIALVCSAVLLIVYVVSRKFFIEVHATGGPPISLLFKPNVLEGVAIDVDQALAVVDVIRDRILNEGARIDRQPTVAPTVAPPLVYVEDPYEASAWATPAGSSNQDDENRARDLFARARQHAQNGEKQRAVSVLQEIVQKYPNTPTAEEARRQLQKRGG